MTERIRWHDDPRGCCTGYVGMQERRAFTIWPPLNDADEWMLDCAFSDVPDERAFGSGPDELKAEAERWLERFVSSLGAVFPADEDEDDDWDDCERPTGEAFEALYAPGCRVRFAHPDAGYPADQKMAAVLLTPGEVYTIEWSDVGFTSTRIALVGIESRGQGFNSVLFEPVNDQEAAPEAAGEKE